MIEVDAGMYGFLSFIAGLFLGITTGFLLGKLFEE